MNETDRNAHTYLSVFQYILVVVQFSGILDSYPLVQCGFNNTTSELFIGVKFPKFNLTIGIIKITS